MRQIPIHYWSWSSWQIKKYGDICLGVYKDVSRSWYRTCFNEWKL